MNVIYETYETPLSHPPFARAWLQQLLDAAQHTRLVVTSSVVRDAMKSLTLGPGPVMVDATEAVYTIACFNHVAPPFGESWRMND